MNTRLLQSVLRHAAALADGSTADDAVLLRRFAASRDPAAFAELVHRYGRLVWAVCRQLRPTDADAEDAFQATFLVLLRSAGTVRTNALGPWLHTVAHRVAGKAARTDGRRRKREHAAATLDQDAAVPPSAWDALAAAVHEEVAKLPEHLRVPFVLCCLEGRGTTDAAKQLGWKLGTLSGRLTRAKQTLLDRLAKRGLPASAVAITLTATAVPAAVAAKALDLIHLGDTIPSTILELAKGATTMTKTKLLAAAVLVAAGLSATVGGWLASANAQTPDVARETLKLAEAIDKAAQKPAAKWEYDYVTPAKHADGFGEYAKDFEKLLERRETDGWTFLGQVNVWVQEKGGVLPRLVFRRPKDAAAKAAADANYRNYLTRMGYAAANPEVAAVREVVLQRMRKDSAETFAAALATKLKVSPELADAVETYGRTVLETEVLSLLLAEARRDSVQGQRRAIEATAKQVFDMAQKKKEEAESEAAAVQKSIQELRERKTVQFKAADFGITGQELTTVIMKAIERKFDPKKNPKPFDLTGSADSVYAVGAAADVEWLTKLMESVKKPAK